jgi:hypothetical protein
MIGAKGHETRNHFEALARHEREGREPPGTYDAAVAELWERDPKRAMAIGLTPPGRNDGP